MRIPSEQCSPYGADNERPSDERRSDEKRRLKSSVAHRPHLGEADGDPDHSARGLLADFYSEQALAHEMDVTVRTLRRWRKERTGPDITLVGRKILYSKDSVFRWLTSREQQMVRGSRRAP
jgi:hypothetical protein